MNLKDLLIKNGYEPTTMEHKEKYTKIIELLGYENIKQFIPFRYAEIKNAIKCYNDQYLNTLPLIKWDSAANISVDLYLKSKGITSSSLAERVCILKQCARMSVEV